MYHHHHHHAREFFRLFANLLTLRLGGFFSLFAILLTLRVEINLSSCTVILTLILQICSSDFLKFSECFRFNWLSSHEINLSSYTIILTLIIQICSSKFSKFSECFRLKQSSSYTISLTLTLISSGVTSAPAPDLLQYQLQLRGYSTSTNVCFVHFFVIKILLHHYRIFTSVHAHKLPK